MGTKFWIGLFGMVIGGAIVAMLLFLFLGWAWAAWGVIGVFVFIGAVLLLVGWVSDRREDRERGYLAGD